MISSDLPHYIKYNPSIFAQANNESSTGLILESYDSKISLALGNNSSNIYSSNLIFLTSENNSFKIQRENNNINKDIIKYEYDNNNVTSILYGSQTADKFYVKNINETSIVLNSNLSEIAGFGYNENNKSLNYTTVYNGKHTFKAKSGIQDIDIATLCYSNSVPQVIINGDKLNPQTNQTYSLNVNGSANINGNLNINGTIIGTFPSGVVQLNSNNKIDTGLLPQLAPDFRVLKSGKNIGIGTKNPISKLHIYNGDILLQNGWIGINTNSNSTNAYPPKYPLHLNYEVNTLPALVLTSNDIINFIAYADHPAIGIGTNKIDSPNISIYAKGDLQCQEIFSSGLNITKNNKNILYYKSFNTTNSLVSEYPLILNETLYVSTISSSSKNINFSNCDILTDNDIVIKDKSLNTLINQYYSGQFIGFGIESNIKFNINVESSNAKNIAGFGSRNKDGVLITLYTSNNISSNYIFGINDINEFIIKDNINNDINGIKYCSDILKVDNIITSNITVISKIGEIFNTSNMFNYNLLNNRPLININEFTATKLYCSNSIKINNIFNDSALEILGKTKLYNERNIYPSYIECGSDFISFLTNTNMPFKYTNTTTINPLSVFSGGLNFLSLNIISKLLFIGKNNAYISDDKVFIDYNGIFSSNIIFNNPLTNILDISFDDNTVYYINKNNNKAYYAGYSVNINANNLEYNINYSLLINNNVKYIKIRAGNNFGLLLDDSNNIYSFGDNNLSQLGRIVSEPYYNYNIIGKITEIPINSKIIDISCGYSHSAILYEDGSVWTFGDNTAYKRGYNNTNNNDLLLPKKITAITEKIIKILCRYDNSIFLSENGNVYISGNINNKISNLSTTPLMLQYLPKIIDISCGKNNVSLLTYYNEIFTFNNLDTIGDYTNIARDNKSGSQYEPCQINLPYNFYGTSLYSHGIVVIGNKYFSKSTQLPKNSLIVEGKVGIGTLSLEPSLYSSNDYSLVLVGNVNIINGNIYKNGILYSGGSSSFGSPANIGVSSWELTENSIYYKGLNNTNVGIGTTNPKRNLSVEGDIGLTGNIYVNDKLLINDYNIWKINTSNIYFNDIGGKVGINTSIPVNSLDIFDTSVSIRNLIVSSNIIDIDNDLVLPINITPLPPSILDIGNNIEISANGNTIATSLFKVYSGNYNSNNVYLYTKNINKTWNKTTIISPKRENISFGNSLKISEDGKKLVIGCYNDYLLEGIIKKYNGSLYICDIDNFSSNIIYSSSDSSIITIYGPANRYIGQEFAISYDASVIVCSAYEDNNILYIYEKSNNINNINNINGGYVPHYIDYSTNYYHNSFGDSQTINKDGTIIVTTFVTNVNVNFIYNNIYIIKKINGVWNVPIFLTKNINNANYIINNVSISNDGKKLIMSITDNRPNILNKDVVYIYNLIDNYLYNNIYTIETPHYILTVPSNNIFHAKISGDGLSILLTPYKIINNNSSSYHFRYDIINDIWMQTIISQNDDNIYTVKGSIVYDGYDVVLALGNSVIVNDRAMTPLNSQIKYYEIYKEKVTFYTDKSGNISVGSNNTIAGYDLNVNGTIGSKLIITDKINVNTLNAFKLYGNGEYIDNININNINGNTSNIYDEQLFIGSNNSIKQSSNLSWNFNSKTLSIKGTLYSDEIYSDNGYNIKNINMNNVHSNSILSVKNGGTGTSNLLSDFLLIGNDININQSSNLLFRNNILYVNGTIISQNYIGDGKNISNINISNINNGMIDVLYGGTGVSKLIKNQLILGNISNIYQTSNLYWDILNNKLGINNISPNSEIDVNGTITASLYIGNGKGISNIISSNIIGNISVENGGTGYNNINYGQLLVGNNNNKLITSDNLVWSNNDKSLIVNGNIYGNIIQGKILGDGYYLSNIDANNIIGKIPTINGGIGDLDVKYGEILLGGLYKNIVSSSNFYWNNNTNCLGINTNNPRSELDIIGTINANYYYGDGKGLSNIIATNITGMTSIINGGTGCNLLPYGYILIGNNSNPLITTSNLSWDNNNNSLIIKNGGSIYAKNINGDFYGNGIGLSNIISSNLIGLVSVINGGTGYSNIEYGRLLVGNNNNKLITSANLIWSNINNKLIVNGEIYANKIQGYFTGDGSGLSNIYFNNIYGTIGVTNGGTGCNILPSGCILVGNNTSSTITSSNLLWNDKQNILEIKGNIYASNIVGSSFIGNGNDLSNISSDSIVGKIKIINGGTGCNLINYGSILVGNNDNPIIISSNLIWSNVDNLLKINGSLYANNIEGSYSGDGKSIYNIVASNIISQISITNGGTGCNILPFGSILIGNDKNPLKTTSNLMWNMSNNELIIDGNIYANIHKGSYIGDGINISNIVASNIIGILKVNNGGSGYNNIPYGSILVGNNNDKLICPSNLIWSNLNNSLIIDGTIYAKTIKGAYIGNGANISNIVASNIIGVLPVLNGGTGSSLLNQNQILVGDNSSVYQTPNLIWNKSTNMLGINTSVPNYNIDVNGDINFNGRLLKNGTIYIAPSAFNNYPLLNAVTTQSNLMIGYENVDSNYMLKVNGRIFSSDDITAFSDEKYKTNIVTIDDALNKVNSLRGVYFNRLDLKDTRRHTGVIAQEINKILPEVVTDSSVEGLSVAYGNVIGLLIEAIKDLSKKIDVLEKKSL